MVAAGSQAWLTFSGCSLSVFCLQLFLHLITTSVFPLFRFSSPSPPPPSPFPFGRRSHFIMAHAGLLLPTSSKLCAICHWGSVDEFLWLPLPLSPKNLIRSAQGPNRFLSCLDCIYRRSVAQRSPNRAFHNYSPFRFVYLYPPVQYLPSLFASEWGWEVYGHREGTHKSLWGRSENH